jgi:hypothetical protein
MNFTHAIYNLKSSKKQYPTDNTEQRAGQRPKMGNQSMNTINRSSDNSPEAATR